MMLETAKTKCQQAMDSSDKIRKKQKSLDKTAHKLLGQVLLSKEMPEKKRTSEENSDKKPENQAIWKKLKCTLFGSLLLGCTCSC